MLKTFNPYADPLNNTGGFFSECTFRIAWILNFFSHYRTLPDSIDSSQQFMLYKIDESEDITKKLFIDINIQIQYEHDIDFYAGYQNRIYKQLKYDQLKPFITKYFSPCQFILDKKQELIEKYNIDLTNTIGVYYRGTDKKTEIEKVSYSDYIEKLKEIYTGKETILIQSDEKQFLDFAKEIFPNSICFSETKVSTIDKGLHYQNTKEENYDDIQYFFAAVLILSQCKHLITGISNCSLWICLYRGHGNNLHQNFHGKFIGVELDGERVP
jgi:hypothetical protein